jgi:hypothetical protein
MLEPNSTTPALGLQICGNTQIGSLEVRFFTKKGEVVEVESHRSVPVGMFADGGLHEIAVSISRKSHTITFYLDQSIMSTDMNTHTYVYDIGYGNGEMFTLAVGKVFLGALDTPLGYFGQSFIGRMKHAYIETDNRLPYQKMHQVVGFNERGYESCIGYSDGLVDQGLCGEFYETDDPIFMPPQRFFSDAINMLHGTEVLSKFASAECREVWMKYACSSFIMPCATYEHGGIQYSFPRLPCKGQCETFMAACRDDLIAALPIMHASTSLRWYTAKLWDTFCDLTVDWHCNGEPDAPLCYGEWYRGNSVASYVDIFQQQQAHPVEGSLLPDGGIIPCASNNASYSGHSTCPQGFAPYSGIETEKLCVFPCTTFLYTREQIDSQFSAYVASGLTGMVFNFSLIAWYSSSFLFEWNQKRRGKKKAGWSTLPRLSSTVPCLGFCSV